MGSQKSNRFTKLSESLFYTVLNIRHVFVFKERFHNREQGEKADQKADVPCCIKMSHVRAVDGNCPHLKTPYLSALPMFNMIDNRTED